jgi:hypothetical protein
MAKETFISRFSKEGRKRVQRTMDGDNEYRAHHAALGAGWLRNTPERFVFTADDGRTLDLTKWEEIAVGRVKRLFNRKSARTAEDADYQSVLMDDGATHEFRFEFVE